MSGLDFQTYELLIKEHRELQKSYEKEKNDKEEYRLRSEQLVNEIKKYQMQLEKHEESIAMLKKQVGAIGDKNTGKQTDAN